MKKEWILVADGSKAKILKRENHSLVHVFPTYHVDDMVAPLDKDSSRLGRVQESHEITRHAYSPQEEYKDIRKKEFIKKMSEIMNKNLTEYDRLVIIAPAERLGEMRVHLTDAAKEKVIREIDKDLVKASLEDVYKYVVRLPD